jgi:predicted helicase
VKRNKIFLEEINEYRKTLYRPFTIVNSYFGDDLNQERYQLPKLFPNKDSKNLVICVSGIGANKDFSTLITDSIPDLQFQFNGQCFPLYYYEEQNKQSPTLFDIVGESEYTRRDGISDFILERAKKQYGNNVCKEDIFYYVYGILHSSDYRNIFINDLKKKLPRIPLIEDVRDFWRFSKAGRQLAELHINYESMPSYEGVQVSGLDSNFFKVVRMHFPSKNQKDTIIYNSKITISNIPVKAYKYVVNGKSAIEWIMERYKINNDDKNGIKNDPNDWAEEVGNPRYILDLLLSIINVSVQTVDIVDGLPKLTFE